MRGAVLRWPGSREAHGGWTNEELAELYRVEHALTQAAIAVETECGASDEGDPWFVFCHPDGQVVVHIARIDGLYHLHCAALPRPLSGPSFEALTRAYVATIPRPLSRQRAGAVVAHPSALLSLLVAAAMVSVDALEKHSAEAKEAPPGRAARSAAGHAHPDAKRATHKAFVETLAAAAWRDRSVGGAESGRDWRAVELAALAFAALYEANLDGGRDLAFAPSASAATSADMPTSLTEAAKTLRAFDEGQGRGGLAAVAAAPAIPLQAVAPPVTLHWAPADAAAELSGFVVAGGEGLGANASRGAPLTEALRNASSPGALAAAVGAALASAAARQLAVTLAASGESLALAPDELWSLLVSGRGELTLLNAGAAATIDVASRTTADIALFYDPSSPAPDSQMLTLEGATDVSLAVAVPPNHPVRLIVDSRGARPNELNVDGAGQPVDFSLRVIGAQDLTLHESAATFEASRLDASKLTGALELGVDFSAAGSGAIDLSVSSGNFIVRSQDSIAMENLPSHATVEISVDLNSAIFGFARGDGDPAPQPELTLGLGVAGESVPVNVGLIDAVGVGDLSIVSSGGDNAVQTIFDHALTQLRLSGDGALDIGAIQGVGAADSQSIAIDAGGLNGFLTLDASAIGDVGAGGRSVSIALGPGGGVITDMAASESVAVTIGSGPAVLHLADGATLDTIAGLTTADEVFIGEATVADTSVDALTLNAAQQGTIDASASLVGAASTAVTLADATGAHQAVLFSYHGDSYVFIDAAGGHVFDPSVDAIVKLVGAAPTSDFSGVFHST